MVSFFNYPVIKNPTRSDAGIDSPQLATERLSVRLGANSGNVAFIHAIQKEIHGIRHISEVHKGYGDINVLGCANQINPNIIKSENDGVFHDTDAPFVAIGLGAQAPDTSRVLEIPDGTVGYIKRIQDSAPGDSPNMTVRGEYTYRVLEKAGLHERAIPLGCPSLFIHPNAKLGVLLSRRVKRWPVRIATAPGNVMKVPSKHQRLEASLAEIADQYGGGYILQHPKELMSMLRDDFRKSEEADVERLRRNIQPSLNTDEFKRWFRVNARLFTSAVAWMEYLRGVDLVIGTRIHGCMLAIQVGTPAVCIAHDSRQEELCAIMQIPNIPAAEVLDGVSVEQVFDRLRKHDWAGFDVNRMMLANKYRKFLENNGLRPSRHMEKLLSN